MIAAQIGAEFEYITAASYGQTLELVKSGQADILGYYINENDAFNPDGLNITKII